MKENENVNHGDILLNRQESGREPMEVTSTLSNNVISEEFMKVLLASPNSNGNKTQIEKKNASTFSNKPVRHLKRFARATRST